MLILLVSMVNRSAIILKILQILNNARKNLTALIIRILCCWLTQAQGSASWLYIQRTTIRESQDPGKFNSILFLIFEQIKADSDYRSSFKLFSSSHFLKKKIKIKIASNKAGNTPGFLQRRVQVSEIACSFSFRVALVSPWCSYLLLISCCELPKQTCSNKQMFSSLCFDPLEQPER